MSQRCLASVYKQTPISQIWTPMEDDNLAVFEQPFVFVFFFFSQFLFIFFQVAYQRVEG